MEAIKKDDLERYLQELWGPQARLLGCSPIGKTATSGDAKGFGYGIPLRVDVDLAGRKRSVVLETMSANAFGHEDRSDRAQSLLWSHSAYNVLPRHAPSHDVGATRRSGSLVSLGNTEEFFVLMEFVEGDSYAKDLARIQKLGEATDADQARADALCDYLVEIHRVRGTEPGLYVRRIRELIGHGECIMGILDSYPPGTGLLSEHFLKDLERRLIDWRWTLKARTARLCQVHGDFHPWNLLFRNGIDFTVLDRSRGEWGEAADDVTCITLNYAFFSLLRGGRLEGAFLRLFERFWKRYLEGSGDEAMLDVAAPFLTFRSLVMASPIWYPTLNEDIRHKLLGFARRVLDTPRFDPFQMKSTFFEG